MEQKLGKCRCSTAAPALLNCFQSAADENLMKEAAPEETEAAQMAETSEKVMVLVGSASDIKSDAFVHSSHLKPARAERGTISLVRSRAARR